MWYNIKIKKNRPKSPESGRRMEESPMKKLLPLALALAMLCSLSITASAAETEADLSDTIIILHTNDVHGAVDGYAKAAALKATYEGLGAYVLLLDAGDFVQGTPEVNLGQGETAIELMNLAGYDVAAPGNHEFDFGYSNLKELEKRADFELLSANVQYKNKAAFDGNTTFQAPDGTKIGVFGLTTPESATSVHPKMIKNVTFLGGEELFDCARAQVEELKAEGCDVIICLGHLGIDPSADGWRSVDLLEQVDGIDLFIDGHSHTDLADVQALVGEDCMVNDAILTSAGTAFESIGLAVISDGALIATTLLLEDLTVDDDKETAAYIKELREEIDKEYGAVFAKSEVLLNGERADIRTKETNLGDLVTDAMLWAASEADVKADMAVVNGGSIRTSIPAGEITRKQIHTVLPFNNTLAIVEVTGAELLEALEASTYLMPESLGSFPQVAGIECTVDIGVPYDQGDLYPGTTYHAPASIRRVTIKTVGGEVFDLEKTYTIATNDYLAADGDTYSVFGRAAVNYDTGIALDQAVMDYIDEKLHGVVKEKGYGRSAGRITAVANLPFVDVAEDASYHDDVLYVWQNNIFRGFTDTMFGPQVDMNRGQMVTVLWRMSGSPDPTINNPFDDVEDYSAYSMAIAWAYENNLVKGYGAGRFRPELAITRQQFLTILYNYAAYKGMDVSVGGDTNILSYKDSEYIAGYAFPALQWACGTGIAYDFDGYLRPDVPAPRYQVAEFLAAFCRSAA